jgi:hypothetical protein
VDKLCHLGHCGDDCLAIWTKPTGKCLLLLFIVAANKELTLPPKLLEVTYSGTLFGFVFLL